MKMISGSSDWRELPIGANSTQIADGFKYLRLKLEKKSPHLKQGYRFAREVKEILREQPASQDDTF